MRYTISTATMSSKDECNKKITTIKTGAVDVAEGGVKALIFHLAAGHAIIPGVMAAGSKVEKASWRAQQLYALDFDNEEYAVGSDGKKVKVAKPESDRISMEQIIEIGKAAGAAPAIVHESFSSSEELRKYRAYYIASEETADGALRDKVQDSLMAIYGEHCDSRCSDRGRVFYAGPMERAYICEDAAFNASALIAAYPAKAGRTRKASARKQHEGAGAGIDTDNEFALAIADCDVEGYRNMLISDAEMDNETIIKYTQLLSHFSFDDAEELDVPTNTAQLDRLVSQLDMAALFGVDDGKNISCFFHADKKASARIHPADDGVYVYHCFACKETYSLLTFIARLQGKGVQAAADFFCDVFGLERIRLACDDAVAEIKSAMDLIGSDYARTECGRLYSITKAGRHMEMLREILSYAAEKQTAGLTKDGSSIFYISVRYAAEMLADKLGSGFSAANTGKKLNYLVELGLLNKVAECDLTQHTIAKAKEVAAKSKSETAKSKKKNDTRNAEHRQDYFRVPAYSVELLKQAESIAARKRATKERAAGQCRAQALLAAGKDVADTIYVQDTDKDISRKLAEFFEDYKAAARALLSKHGYFTEKLLLALLDSFGEYSDYEKQNYSNICFAGMLKELGLKTCRGSKATREAYGIRIPEGVDPRAFANMHIILPLEPAAAETAEETAIPADTTKEMTKMTFDDMMIRVLESDKDNMISASLLKMEKARKAKRAAVAAVDDLDTETVEDVQETHAEAPAAKKAMSLDDALDAVFAHAAKSDDMVTRAMDNTYKAVMAMARRAKAKAAVAAVDELANVAAKVQAEAIEAQVEAPRASEVQELTQPALEKKVVVFTERKQPKAKTEMELRIETLREAKAAGTMVWAEPRSVKDKLEGGIEAMRAAMQAKKKTASATTETAPTQQQAKDTPTSTPVVDIIPQSSGANQEACDPAYMDMLAESELARDRDAGSIEVKLALLTAPERPLEDYDAYRLERDHAEAQESRYALDMLGNAEEAV